MTPLAVLESYLRPYQREWIEDLSPRKIALKSRRVGFSQAAIVEALLEAMRHTGRDVYLVSTTYTDAKELLKRLDDFITALELAGLALPITERLTTRMAFANGSRIIPIPAHRVRGRGGTIIWDEVAYTARAREHWAAIAPAADTDPTMRVVLISTPFGASGLYHDIWHDDSGEYGRWSRHQVDIYQAADQGFPVDAEELRAKYDEVTWRQEFCCEFLDDVDQYFDFDLIRRAQYAPSEAPEWLADPAQLLGGLDLGSASSGSYLAPLASPGRDVDVGTRRLSRELWALDPVEIKAPGAARDYEDQRRHASQILSSRSYDRLAVDANGEGAQVAQDLRRDHGEIILAVRGGQWSHVYELIPDMRAALERGLLRLPYSATLRTAMAKIRRKTTSTGQVRYEARTDAEGHADAFYALLLGYYAATQRARKGRGRGRERRQRKASRSRVRY